MTQEREGGGPIPATLLTGFLGAGKTTLLNRILRAEHGLRIAVVVNDVGAVNIDERLVETVHGGVLGLSNGCICCDTQGDLRRTLLNLVDLPRPPEYILVEASGIADPVASAQTFRISELRNRIRLDAIVTLVDAEHVRDPRLDAQLVRDQIMVADIIVLNKVDLVNERQRADLRHWLQSIVPGARIFEAVQSDVPLELLLDTGLHRKDFSTTHRDHGDHRHKTYETWLYRNIALLDLHETLAALKKLPPSIFRAKGVLALADAPRLRISLQMVGKRLETDVLGPWDDEQPHTELVFIGEHGALSQPDLEARFARAMRLPDVYSGSRGSGASA